MDIDASIALALFLDLADTNPADLSSGTQVRSAARLQINTGNFE
jgi:hypothetical protein